MSSSATSTAAPEAASAEYLPPAGTYPSVFNQRIIHQRAAEVTLIQGIRQHGKRAATLIQFATYDYEDNDCESNFELIGPVIEAQFSI